MTKTPKTQSTLSFTTPYHCHRELSMILNHELSCHGWALALGLSLSPIWAWVSIWGCRSTTIWVDYPTMASTTESGETTRRGSQSERIHCPWVSRHSPRPTKLAFSCSKGFLWVFIGSGCRIDGFVFVGLFVDLMGVWFVYFLRWWNLMGFCNLYFGDENGERRRGERPGWGFG